ncbi:MAG: hypothetical protein NC182_04390 [Prevotella sp.]|nr:hypothetical protein [Staphylococcus sp.]MCM1350421.1 hypothetical protein [Prevotella sp.]
MKQKLNQFWIVIWTIILLVYNAVLFLLVNQLKKELFDKPAFWVNYAWMMIAFLIWLVVELIAKSTQKGNLRPLTVVVYPFLAVSFLTTSILYFFAMNIVLIGIIIPMIMIIGLFIIGYCLASVQTTVLERSTKSSKGFLRVEDLTSYFSEIEQYTSDKTQRALHHLTILCRDLHSVEKGEEVKQLEKRIYEYASFIEKDIQQGEDSNVYLHIEKLEQLLKERANLIAK